MHKATANGGANKCMNIYEVLKAVGFGNMHTGSAVTIMDSSILIVITMICIVLLVAKSHSKMLYKASQLVQYLMLRNTQKVQVLLFFKVRRVWFSL